MPSIRTLIRISLLLGLFHLGGHFTLPRAQAQVAVDTIEVVGNSYTKPWVVLRELTFEPGDTLPEAELEALLERNRKNVANLNFFTLVEFEPLIADGRLRLQIKVKERFRLGGRAILALEERNSYDVLNALMERDFHRLVYGEQLTWRNITGRGEVIRWDFQWGFSRRLRFELSRPLPVREPNVDLIFGVRYDWQPEIIIGTENGQVRWEGIEGGALQRRYGGYFSVLHRRGVYHQLEFRLSYDQYHLADSLYAFSLENGPNRYLTNGLGLEQYGQAMLRLAIDKRDWRSYPLSGYKGQLMTRWAGGPGATTQFGKIGATWSHHLPLSDRFNFAYGGTSVITIGDSLPFFEKSQLGIRRPEFPGLSNELRGYQPYVIDGTWLNVAKSEFKFALIPYRWVSMDWLGIPWISSQALALYLTAFADVGYVRDWSYNNRDQWLKDQFLYGYGVGLNLIVIYDMLWRVEYARNHLGQGGIYFHGTLPIK